MQDREEGRRGSKGEGAERGTETGCDMHELLGRKSVSVQICMKDIFMEEKSGHDDLVLNQSHIKSLGG